MLSFPCMTLVIVTSSTQLLSSNEFSPLPIIIILKFSTPFPPFPPILFQSPIPLLLIS